MAIIVTSPDVLALQNTVERVDITVQDATSDPAVVVDPTELKLQMMDLGGNTKVYDAWPSPANRIVRTAVGKFYIEYGYPYAALDGVHSTGAATLNITGAYPPEGVAWPETGSIFLDAGLSTEESVRYSALSITGGVGTVTLVGLTTEDHTTGTYCIGPNTETRTTGDVVLNWKIRLSSTGEQSNVIQKIRCASVRSASFVADLRQIIDKSKKLIDVANDCYLGYTDSQLMAYMEGGLNTINAYQPSLNFTMDNFPLEYKQILIDSALITGVISQQLYSIDTDIPSYNDQGTSFVITHQPQLAGFLNQITSRLDKLIPMMKLQLISPGSLHIQTGPNFRLTQLVEAAPNGSLFRGIVFKG